MCLIFMVCCVCWCLWWMVEVLLRLCDLLRLCVWLILVLIIVCGCVCICCGVVGGLC